MKAITKLAIASVLVAATAGCKHRESIAASSGSGSATPAAGDPTTAIAAPINIAPNQPADAGSDALPDRAGAVIAPTMPSVDAALDGGPATGAVTGTTNGTPTPDAF